MKQIKITGIRVLIPLDDIIPKSEIDEYRDKKGKEVTDKLKGSNLIDLIYKDI